VREACRIIKKGVNMNTRLGQRRFAAHFGCSVDMCMLIWRKLQRAETLPNMALPKHLLWTLAFLKLYGSEMVMAALCGCHEKTLRKWVWSFIEAIACLEIVSCGGFVLD